MTEMIGIIIENLLNLETLMGLMIGTVGGMIIGALPGLGATMGVALMVPLTFGMSPVAGMVMLTAIYTSATYGGSISAILISTPGTPASAATAIDGYQLTKQGKGLKALGVATISSMIGGTISAVALLFIAPPLSTLSLQFNAPENFLIAVFGLTIISSLAADSLAKGLAAGVIGLIVGTVGTDIMTGFPRFTFGITALEGGIALVPAMIGLFSLSQVMIQVESLIGDDEDILGEIKGIVLPSIKEFLRLLPTIIKSTIIGVIVGIIPGAGGDISSWVGYNEAKRSSKNYEKFGKGALEGVAAPEAANNAVTGGALIPLLTLGIPGSSTTAVMLGGLLIQGLQPGHELFSVHADITYSIIFGFLLANIVMGAIGLLAARYLVKVTQIPYSILGPFIVIFSVVGSYAINNSVTDINVMIIFGLIGYLMRKAGFATAPVVLGIILGPLAERGLRTSLILGGDNILAYYFSRPISVFLIILIIFSLFSPYIIKKLKEKGIGISKGESGA